MKKLIARNLLLLTILFLLLITPILVVAVDPLTASTQIAESEKCDSASGFCLGVPIGGISKVSGFEEYLQLWYSFVVGVVGILSAVIIMWGGFKWLTSRGNSAAISDAKDRIWSAIIGLILVFVSITLLNIINPKLTNIHLPSLPTSNITKPATQASTQANTSTPTHPAESAIFDTEALKVTCLDAIYVTGANLNCDKLNINSPVSEARIIGSTEMGYSYEISDNFLEGVQQIVDIIGDPQTINGENVFVMRGTNIAFQEIDNNLWRVQSTNIVGMVLEQDTNTQQTVAWPRDEWERLHNIQN